jgi:hypothetical protein
MKPEQLRNISLVLVPVMLLASGCFPGKKQGESPQGNSNAGAASNIITSPDGLTRMNLPAGWKQEKEQELNDQADLQASDRANEMYVIVMSESKEDFRDMTVDKHSQSTRSSLIEKLESPEVSDPKPVTVGGLGGVQYEIRGGLENLNIVYLHTTVESPTHFHQILAWTLKSRFDKNRGALDAVIHSFKEVAPAAK